MRSLSVVGRHGFALCIVVVVVGALTAVPAATAAHVSVFPPRSKPLGKTYGQWSAEWWKQAVRQTGAPNTPFAAGAVNCTALGTQRVVFLVGTTAGTGSPVERSCVVGKHAAILFPVVNAECSVVEGDGSTESQLRACAASLADTLTNLHATVDDHALARLCAFRFASPLYRFSPVPDNVFRIPEAVLSPSVADGYWVMLHKLKKGTHTVSFGGAAAGSDFSTDTTYRLTVR